MKEKIRRINEGFLLIGFDLKYFSYIDDKGDFFEKADITQEKISTNFGCNHGCGIFELIKK